MRPFVLGRPSLFRHSVRNSTALVHCLQGKYTLHLPGKLHPKGRELFDNSNLIEHKTCRVPEEHQLHGTTGHASCGVALPAPCTNSSMASALPQSEQTNTDVSSGFRVVRLKAFAAHGSLISNRSHRGQKPIFRLGSSFILSTLFLSWLA